MATVTTNNQGHYQFGNLLPGSYYIHFDISAAYQVGPANMATENDAFDSDVDPNSGNTPVIVVTSGQRDTTVDLGLRLASGQQPVSLGDWVWHDANANGVQDATETGVPGIPVALYRADETLVATTTTAADGHYQFSMLPPGDYYLQFSPPTGYLITPAVEFVLFAT